MTFSEFGIRRQKIIDFSTFDGAANASKFGNQPSSTERICVRWDCACSIYLLFQTADRELRPDYVVPCDVAPRPARYRHKCEAKAPGCCNSSLAWLSKPSQDSPRPRKGRASYLKSGFYRPRVLFMAGTKVTVSCAGRAALLPVAPAHNSPVSGCTEPA